MAVRTVTDTVARVTNNGPDGDGTLIRGNVEFDRFGAREGVLLDVDYQVFLTVQTTGGLVNDGNTFFGSATTFFGFDLDPGNDDGLGMDYLTEIQDGPSSIPLLAGAGVSTAVTYSLSARSPKLDVAQTDRFVGNGEVKVGFDFFSGVAAFGGQILGPQGGSFTNANTARVVVEYTYRPAIEGNGKNNRLDGTKREDVLLGKDGNDVLRGGGEADRLYGDAGRDNLAGEAGNDRLYGGGGADVFVFTRGGGLDRVMDLREDDRLDLSRFDVRFSEISLVRNGDNTQVRIEDRVLAVIEDTRPGDLDRDDFIL